MKRSLLIIAVWLTAALSNAPAQTIRYEGSEAFRLALFQHDLQPLSDIKQALLLPQETVIIMFGDSAAFNRMLRPGELQRFVTRGGSILIATDGPAPSRNISDWAQDFGVVINGHRVTSLPELCYRKTYGRPFVVPQPAPIPFRREPSAFDLFAGFDTSGPNAVATDHPSEMIHFVKGDRIVHVLAKYPADARRLGARLPISEQANAFALSLQFPGRFGRMIVMADESVFINGMLGVVEDPTAEKGYRFDNANWELANRTITWLKGGGNGDKRSCLFVENGTVIDKFAVVRPDVNRPPIPDIPPEVLANILLNHSNGVINELQEKNYFNRLLDRWLTFPRIARIFLLVVTVILLVSLIGWLGRSVRRMIPSANLTARYQEGLQPRGGILRQQADAQIDADNLFDAARRRIRDRYDLLGGAPDPNGAMPPILLAADCREPERLRRAVAELWQIGYGPRPLAVPADEWDRINLDLERSMAQAARGDWTFGQDIA